MPMGSLSNGFSTFGSGLKALTYTSNKCAHKNVVKIQQFVEGTFACADLEPSVPREAVFPIVYISNGNRSGRQQCPAP